MNNDWHKQDTLNRLEVELSHCDTVIDYIAKRQDVPTKRLLKAKKHMLKVIEHMKYVTKEDFD